LVDSTSSHKRNRSNTGLSVQSTITNDSTQASSIFEPINTVNTVHSLNKKKFNFSKKNRRKHFKKFKVDKEKPSLLRSSAMKLVQIYIPTEIIHYTLQKLGELSLIHVVDLNEGMNAINRPYISDLRRYNKINDILSYFRDKIDEAHVPINNLKPQHLKYLSSYSQHDIDELEQKLINLRDQVEHLYRSKQQLEKQEIELTEERWVYEKFDSLLSTVGVDDIENDETTALMSLEEGRGNGLERFQISNISGIISKRLAEVFERILWRTFYGNVIINIADIDELFYNFETKEYEKRCVFSIFAHGVEMCKKIRKLADSLDLPLYDVEGDLELRKQHLEALKTRISDINTVLLASQKTLFNQLTSIAGTLEEWYAVIMKERHIYRILNKCKRSQYLKGGIILRGWIPAYEMDKLQEIVDDIKTNIDRNTIPIINELDFDNEEPPTKQETNKFTEGFQNLIDAYGIAKYQEINPGIFTVSTFPFLFAIMFGDSGHGLLMAIFGLVMILLERKMGSMKLNDIIDILFSGRYIILMMGLYSIISGIIYNDCFSKSFIFQFKNSAYKFIKQPSIGAKFVTTKGYKEQGTAFLFGIDPGWIDASNMIIFMNSFKMKMSIILGIAHMSFGVCINVLNDIFFNKKINIFCEFLPEIIMLNSLFGYLCLLIIKKWLTDWTGAVAPSLLNVLINMVLNPGHVIEEEYIYFGQSIVQVILLLSFIICIFWLLLAKPYVIFAERNPHSKWAKWRYLPIFTKSKFFGGGIEGDHEETERLIGSQYDEEYDPLNNDDDDDDDELNDNGEGEASSSSSSMNPMIVEEFMPRRQKEERPFADLIVDQIIHTIEFTLNCISNTASYLRLWALSLAHSQLSSILFDKIFVMGFSNGIPKPLLPITIFITFAIWFFLTIFIMCAMEGMSAFLHTLRLHWVEFNGKFYKGTGYKFEPFSFEQIYKDEKNAQNASG